VYALAVHRTTSERHKEESVSWKEPLFLSL